MFLVRLFLGLFIVVMILPAAPGEDQAPGVGVIESIAAARDAIVDISSLCERQADACSTGREVLNALGEKARQGVSLVYRYVEEQMDRNGAPAGTVERGTLTGEDVEIPWQAPEIRGSV